MMVYGENLQFATGLNHQLALGSNVQICINPAGLAAGVPGYVVPPGVSGLLGSGLGGNMQFTIGTSASFVLGRSFDINLGPPKIEVTGADLASKHVATYVLCGILGALALVWVLFYAGLDEDNERAAETFTFQFIFDLLLAAIMIVEVNLAKTDAATNMSATGPFRGKPKELADAADRYNKMFGGEAGTTLGDWAQVLGVIAAWLAALPLPLVAIAGEETSGFDKKD